MSDNIWGKKLIANEIRPLIATLNNCFMKYQSVKNLEEIIEDITKLNGMLNDEILLEKLNNLSEKKYYAHKRIKEERAIEKRNQEHTNFLDFIETFDEDLEKIKTALIHQARSNYKNLKIEIDDELFIYEPIIAEKLHDFKTVDRYLPINEINDIVIEFHRESGIRFSRFFSYYIIKALNKLEKKEINKHIRHLNEKEFIESTVIFDNDFINEHNFIFSYLKITLKDIKLISDYFSYFPNKEKDSENLKKESEILDQINKDINKIINSRNGCLVYF